MLKKLALWLLLMPMLAVAATTQSLDKVVAIVNDGVITESEVQKEVESLRAQLISRQGQLPSEEVMKKQVLQHLIDFNLQLQIAKRNNIVVDNTDLNESIQSIALANKLTLAQLREMLSKQGILWAAYRENIRKEILISRLQQKVLAKEISISTKQVNNYLKAAMEGKNLGPEGMSLRQDEIFHVQNIIVPLSDEPTSAQLEKARLLSQRLLTKLKQGENIADLVKTQSSSDFLLESSDLGPRHLAELPEIFIKEVLKMKAGDVAGPLRTGNGYQVIKLIAMEKSASHHEVTKTQVRHILLKQSASMTLAEVELQVNNLYQQLKAGKDFAKMAKLYSVDLKSASKGGDLGWVSQGDLVPVFEKAMNDLPLHTVSKPIKSSFGWHIIEVLARKKVDDSESFKRNQVMLLLQQRKFSVALQNWQQHLRADAYVAILDKHLA